MTKTPEVSPLRVVVGRDVIAKSFLDPECRTVLEFWRDGKIQLVITRDLLFVYFRLLQALNIPDAPLRQWVRWFTAKGKAILLADSTESRKDCNEILCEAASRGEADLIVTTKMADPGTGRKALMNRPTSWMTIREFLDEYARER